ncbi:Zinc finger MYM-type protein 5 [Eumeta japonica]|uniref:Zinc finger MYM-type protein 5 n=1 Tax=Eumeta variegata TaxID=151549 RepID=A0A4C1WA80_EUMVA|nr:Zinc finger MYM-type protein 5 [Eumeta japonica]
MSREINKFRKFESGYEKQKKKDKREKFLKPQQGALVKFLKQDGAELQDGGSAAVENLSIVSRKTETPVDQTFLSTSSFNELSNFLPSGNPSASDTQNLSISAGELSTDVNDPLEPDPQNLSIFTEAEGSVFDINDPGAWPVPFSTAKFDEIIQKGPLQVINFSFPQNSEKRHFSAKYYKRIMSNGEEVHRQWLVYSKTSDKAFCFCCKLFGNNTGSQLAGEGYSDWAHIGRGLETHETSPKHVENVRKWKECEVRLNKALTIDKKHRELINKEKRALA